MAKIKVTVYEQKEIEVEFPLYKKNQCLFYKVLNEKDYIIVTKPGANLPAIEGKSYGFDFMNRNIVDSTEAEFKEAYSLADAELNRIINQ